MLHKPRLIFLTDSLGAGLTIVCLVFVLGRHVLFFGVPLSVIHPLAAGAVVLGVFSSYCFLFFRASWRMQMKIISVANALYSLGVFLGIWYCRHEIRWPGLLYFSMEVVIIWLLARLEWKTASRKRFHDAANYRNESP